MTTGDLSDSLFRFFQGEHPRSAPMDGQAARRTLEEGNRRFVDWTERCFSPPDGGAGAGSTGWQTTKTIISPPGVVPLQIPFAAVIGCSDARMPVRLILGQAVNDVFEIRVVGHVLADECLGSIDYALHHLPTIKALVVLGHTHCGAVTAAVDAYLRPGDYLGERRTLGLRSVVHRILPAVTLAAKALERTQPPASSDPKQHRNQLIHLSVLVNAAATARELHNSVEQAGKRDVQVFFGVYDLASHCVGLPDSANAATHQPRLLPAPKTTGDLNAFAETACHWVIEPKAFSTEQ